MFGIGTNYWANTADDYVGSHRWDELSIVFDSPSSNVSWSTQSHGSLLITFNAYDADDNLLETICISGSWIPNGFTVKGISRIQALQPTDDWGWGMDDLSFSEVPEPATYALAGIGLAVLALAQRKRSGCAFRASEPRVSRVQTGPSSPTREQRNPRSSLELRHFS